MLQIITTAKTSSERAACAAARATGIPCAVTKPRRNGPGRRSYRTCLQDCAAKADATIVLGNHVVPYNGDIDSIRVPTPIRLLSIAAEMRFRPTGDSTRQWLRKHRVKTLHVTGSAPRSVAAKFLRALLKP